MRTLLVHLSDIHIHNEDDAILKRAEKIKGAILSLYHGIEKCIIVISGDIAFSGKKEQYLCAIEFLTSLGELLKNENINYNIEIIPGNHDCDFDDINNNQVRKSLTSSLSKNEIKVDESVIASSTSIQCNFFDFYNALKCVNIDKTFFYQSSYKFEDKTLIFYCFNTAWMSSKSEKYGELVFPTDKVRNMIAEEEGIKIALLHHPYNWFTYESRKNMIKLMEEKADIIITGHEHDLDMHVIQSKEGYTKSYIQGGVLQEDSQAIDSSFNIIIVDLDNMSYKYNEFQYNSEIYENCYESDWIYLDNSKGVEKSIRINDAFEEFLNDAGADFMNSNTHKVYLDDIYIFPDVKSVSLRERKENKNTNEVYIKGDKIYELTKSGRETFIIGESISGKTSLAKQLFKNYSSQGFIPLLIDGSDIKNHKIDSLEKLVSSEFVREYSTGKLEVYNQTSKKSKVLLIDNFHKIPFNLAGKNNVVNSLREFFDIIILFSSQEFYMDIITDSKDYNKILLNFSCYEMCPFGFLLRNKLITKWYNIGNEFLIDEIELERKVSRAEEKMNTIFAKNMMPSFPMNILLILPLCENVEMVTDKEQIGSYGYLYEALITNNLLKVKSRIKLDTKYTYLSVLAFEKFSSRLEMLDSDNLMRIHEIYENRYDKKIEFEVILGELEQSNMLKKYGDSYNFKHKYLYYYFVAKYISNNIEHKDIRELVVEISNNIYIEVNANIILFLCHLSRNPFIIECILSSSKGIFTDYEACDLNDSICFLNELYIKADQLVIELGDPKKNKEKYLQEKDSIEIAKVNDELGMEEAASTYDTSYLDENDVEIKKINMLNKSLKTIQILGLIIKNFEGSLLSETKLEVTRECYLLGMRTLTLFMSTLKENLRDFIENFSELLNREVESEAKAKEFICLLSEFFSFNIIKRISASIGLEELNETYKKIRKDESAVSYLLVDANIRMENYKDFPTSLIIQLNKDLKKNFFADNLLKKLVANYFYLNSCNHSLRQSVCDQLGIQLNKARTLTYNNKLK